MPRYPRGYKYKSTQDLDMDSFNIDNVSILDVDVIKGKVIGIEWNQTDDTWARIDRYGNAITNITQSDFDGFYPWAGMRRVNLSVTGEINAVYGDDNYVNDGTNGRVMVQIPRFFFKSEMIVEGGKTKYRWWISDGELAGFEVHPAFNQRAADPPADYIYVGGYEADFVYDSGGTHAELHSRTGYQPWTGGQIWEVDFDVGTNEPDIGDDISTPNDANWFIVDYVLTGGAWDGSGTGKLWIRKPGDDALGWLDNDVITNNTQANQLATCEFTGGTKTALTFDIGDARTYAGNIGTGWGLMNIWTLSAIQLLFMIEYGNMDSQTNVGRGIVDKASGTGFAGELTGADSIDTNVGANGTGTGTGTNGLTPIAYRWIENLWGNVWIFADGYNAVDAEYRIINRDGSGTFADPIAGGDYEASEATPIGNDGYISNIEYENILKYFLFAQAVAGSSSTYIPDQFDAHEAGETNIALASSPWDTTTLAGLATLNSLSDAAGSGRKLAGRCEHIS